MITVETILIGVLLALIIALGIIILLKAGGIIIKILLHMAFGFVMLFIVDLIPFIHVPINLLTILVAGFGGFIGVALLVILGFLGFF